MNKALPLLCAAAMLAGCGREPANEAASPAAETPAFSEDTGAALRPGPRWESVASGEGYALRLTGYEGQVLLGFSCVGDGRRLVANVPAFDPAAGDGRLMVDLGGRPLELAADPARQLPGTGVTADAPIPHDLRALVAGAGRVGAAHGGRTEGPHAPPAPPLVEEFVAACEEIAGG